MEHADAVRKMAVHCREQWGLFPIPLYYKSKKPKVKWKEDWMAEPPVIYDVLDLFDEGIAVICGDISNGFCVVDLDDKEFGKKFLAFHKLDTPIVETADGFHVWIREVVPHLPDEECRPIPQLDFRNSETKVPMELRGDAHLCTIPPSVHESGHRYRFMQQGEIMEVEDVVEWLTNALAPFSVKLPSPGASAHSYGVPEDGQTVGQGERQQTLVRKAGYIVRSCRRAGYGMTQAIEQLMEWNLRSVYPPLKEKEVADCVKRIWNSDMRGVA